MSIGASLRSLLQNRIGPALITALLLPVIAAFAMAARGRRALTPKRARNQLRLVWAGPPLLSLVTASDAMKSAGYKSWTIANATYDNDVTRRFDQEALFRRRSPYGLNTLLLSCRASMLFCRAMFEADVLHGYFNGAILARTPLAKWEYRLWKAAGNYLVLMAYGSDSFVYRTLPPARWARAVMETYPRTEREDQAVERNVMEGSKLADAVVGCIVHTACLPRVDFNPVLWYPFDPNLEPVYPKAGRPVRIAHAANHQLIKGTEALEQAVARLVREGQPIELTVLERAKHADVLKAFAAADIVVDQLLFGYALAALEGMALGKVVITGIDNSDLYEPVRRQGLLDNLPIIFSSPEKIYEDLLSLVENAELRSTLGLSTRTYAETVHSSARTVELFSSVYDFIYRN